VKVEHAGLLSNPNLKSGGSINNKMVELAGLLSNPNLAAGLARLDSAVAGIRRLRAADLVSPPVGRPPQGQVLRTIKRILARHPDGLPVSEVRRLVEEEIGRELSRSTVKGALSDHAGPNGAFKRRKRGVYMVKGGK
jgi:hypothetical protein